MHTVLNGILMETAPPELELERLTWFCGISLNYRVASLERMPADAQAGADELGRPNWFCSLSQNHRMAGFECVPAEAQAGANERVESNSGL